MLKGIILSGAAAVALGAIGAKAADMPVPVLPAPAPEACKATLSFPSYNGPIKQNPNPACFTLGGFGDIYVGGAVTGYAYGLTNPFPFSPAPLPNDRASRVDFTNLQAFIQKPEGPVQFYVAVGAYAIPALGFVNYGTFDQTDLLFSPVPVAYGKIQINDAWSIQGGRMPTLIGSEAPFTFQNMNISRGLLFNQENIINHGVQINYSEGPWSVSVAGTDGFYSGELSWFTGSVSYKLNDANTIGVNGGLNLSRTNVGVRSLRYQFATPLLQQNSGIFNINYTYSEGPWTVTPYFQFTNVERDLRIGIVEGASTYGGALLASYAFTDNFALAGRLEYEEQTGRRGVNVASLLYGPGSAAFSATITPTFTFDRFFVRGEYSHVELFNVTAGLGFGRSGTRLSQERYMIEGGITF
jgi:hypothetical protein